MINVIKNRRSSYLPLLLTSLMLVSSGCGGGGGSSDGSNANSNKTTINNSSNLKDNLAEKAEVIIVPETIKPVAQTGLHINEVLAGNSYTNYSPDTKEFSGWVELYNNSDNSINLREYSLSDGKYNWSFPSQNIAPHEYLLVWTDKQAEAVGGLHTNFKLSMDGESIILRKQNEIIDDIIFPKQKNNISFTVQNGELFYMTPSPEAENLSAISHLIRAKKPIFSLESGFYNGTQQLTLEQPDGGEVFYTTDGSIPTQNSQKYTQPITIDKTTVVRARSLLPNYMLSTVKSHTYLINEDIKLPVMSLAVNDEFLNDNEIGIYTAGDGNPIPNYKNNWMRAGSIEYIKDGKSQFSANIGMRIHGATSRENHKKSLNIYAKSRFGKKSIKYKLFDDKNITKFKSFVLRNSGETGRKHTELLKNALIHEIVAGQMDIDYQAYQPSVLFINGQYWGIYNIREKGNESYIENNHGIDRKDVDYLRIDEPITKNPAYDEIVNITDYATLASKIDIDEYINYMITEIYDANDDWPSVNNIAWRQISTNGKWRWVLDDTDNGFGLVNHESLRQLLDTSTAKSYPNPIWSTKLFRTLMQNAEFKNKFVTTFNKHLDTTFQPARVNAIIDQMQAVIAPEVDRDFARWQYTNPSDSWTTMVGYLHSFANNRNAIVRDFLATEIK